MTIVIKDQLDGINLFTEDRRVFTRETGLVGNPVTPCDVICVYTKMNENFKGGINNVMIKNNDLTDSRYHQRCADNGHRSLVHASVRSKPIQEKGRFGYFSTPVRDADWSADYSVGPIPVGEIRINYLRYPAGRRQSPDAAPSTGLLLFYTIRRLRHYCAAAYSTFCDTVWNSLCTEGIFLRRGAFQACQAMDGAVLVHNCSGVAFHAELCIPWDAPRVVINERWTGAIGSVPRPHRIILLGRGNYVDDRRILADGDSRVVQFRRPELHSANNEYGDVALQDKGEAREPQTSAFTIDISAGKPTLVTEVQLSKYTVSEEATVGENWAPDCAPAVLAQVLGENRADQTCSSS